MSRITVSHTHTPKKIIYVKINVKTDSMAWGQYQQWDTKCWGKYCVELGIMYSNHQVSVSSK